MRRIFTLFLFTAVALGVYAEVVLSGIVKFLGSDEPVAGVTVTLSSSGKSVVTDASGEFSIEADKEGNDVLVFSGRGVVNYQRIVDLTEGESYLGVIFLRTDLHDYAMDDMVLVVSEAELDDEGSGQYISGLLSSRGDVFTSNASYQFSPMRFRVRGLDGKYNQTYINGVLMNDAERGFFTYSQVGGLNDMLRTRENMNGMEASTFTFGNVGGAQNINVRASAIRKGLKVSQVASNRTYVSRTMATYATGLMNNGWAFAVSASYRWANSGYVEGTFYDAWAFAVAAEKRFNPNRSLELTHSMGSQGRPWLPIYL